MGTWAHKKCQTHKSDTSDSAAVWLNFYRLEVTGPLLVFLITNIWDSWSGIIEDKIEQAQCPNQRLAGAGVADCGAWHGVGGSAGEGAQEARWGRECRGDGKGERCLQWCDCDDCMIVVVRMIFCKGMNSIRQYTLSLNRLGRKNQILLTSRFKSYIKKA